MKHSNTSEKSDMWENPTYRKSTHGNKSEKKLTSTTFFSKTFLEAIAARWFKSSVSVVKALMIQFLTWIF